MDWQLQFERWRQLSAENKLTEANQLLDEARKAIPKAKGDDRWLWFANALQDQDTCGFVALIFANHPIPKALMGPFLNAGVQHGNASSIKFFVIPCLETFGQEAVNKWFVTHELHDLKVREKAKMARYWYSSAKKARGM